MEASDDKEPVEKAFSLTEMRGEFYRKNSTQVFFSVNIGSPRFLGGLRKSQIHGSLGCWITSFHNKRIQQFRIFNTVVSM